MARVHWQGFEFRADPVRQLDNGSWLMVAKQHGPRFSVGTEIEVSPGEIISMTPEEMPPTEEAKSFAAIEAAMSEERKMLPTPQELIAKAPKTVVPPEPGDA